MKPRSILACILTLSFILISLPTYAIEVELFNEIFTRGKGKPVTVTRTIDSDLPTGQVIITNGVQGSKPVSAADIILNGTKIFRKNDFNNNVDELIIDNVALIEGENTMEVLVKGPKGGAFTVQIVHDVEADAAAYVGPEGGTIETNDAEIYIPPDALDEDVFIAFKEETHSSPLSEELAPAGPVIDFYPNGLVFQSNVRMTISYYDSDNDGIVDLTGASEDNIRVISFSDYHDGLEYVPIISIDKVNNTVTFGTNHFSKYMLVIEPISLSDDTFVFTIEGLDFRTTGWSHYFWNIDPRYVRKQYLRDAIVSKMYPALSYDDIYSYKWDGDATDTKYRVEELVGVLKAKYCEAKKQGKRFIIVTHSWGTVLGNLALQYSPEIIVDLFITLSSPLGANNVNDYINEEWCLGLPVVTTRTIDLQRLIQGFVEEKTNETSEYLTHLTKNGIRYNRWVNFWDTGDIISGPLNIGGYPYEVGYEEYDISFSDNRDCFSTDYVHALTSLDETNAFFSTVDPVLAETIKSEVVLEIINSTNIADQDCDGIPDDGDASGESGDNNCTNGNTITCDDNCPDVSNPDQADSDGDGIGDACEIICNVARWDVKKYFNHRPSSDYLIHTVGEMAINKPGCSEITSASATGPDGTNYELICHEPNDKYVFWTSYPYNVDESLVGNSEFVVTDQEGKIHNCQDTYSSGSLPIPELVNWSNGDVTNTTIPFLDWNDVLGASMYYVRIWDYTHTNLIYDSRDYIGYITESEHIIPSGILEPDEKYQLDIVAVKQQNEPFVHGSILRIFLLMNGATYYDVRVRSAHWPSGYYVNLFVTDPDQKATSVVATGPGISGTMYFSYRPQWQIWWSEYNPFLGTSVPTEPQTYTFVINDAYGTYSYQKTIAGYVPLATNLSPSGNVVEPIVFSWTGIPGNPVYVLELFDMNDLLIWDHRNIPANTTSVAYDGPSLNIGETYYYWLQSQIVTEGERNYSVAWIYFTIVP